MCWVFHKWSRWEDFQATMTSGIVKIMQTRYCEKCNKKQIRDL